MASSRHCFTCSKPSASIHCVGCDKYFCNKCFKTHREGMFGEIEKIIESRNELQEAINNSAQIQDQQSPVIAEINKWEKSTIQKVQQVAAQAREQTTQLLNANRIKIQTDFRSFSQELASLKESEDFVETDLARLNQKIKQFQLDINQSARPTAVQLHTEQSDHINWDSLIYVEEIRTGNNQPLQPQTTHKFLETPRDVTPPAQVKLSCPNHSYIRQLCF